MLPGHASLPNGYGLDFVDADGSEQVPGVAPNALTSSDWRDAYAGTPWHKHVPARIEAGAQRCRWQRQPARERRAALPPAPRGGQRRRQRVCTRRRCGGNGACGPAGMPGRRRGVGGHRPLRQQQQRIAAADLLRLHRRARDPSGRSVAAGSARRAPSLVPGGRFSRLGRWGTPSAGGAGGIGCGRRRGNLGRRRGNLRLPAARGLPVPRGRAVVRGRRRRRISAGGCRGDDERRERCCAHDGNGLRVESELHRCPLRVSRVRLVTGCICSGRQIVTPLAARVQSAGPSGRHFAQLVSPTPLVWCSNAVRPLDGYLGANACRLPPSRPDSTSPIPISIASGCRSKSWRSCVVARRSGGTSSPTGIGRFRRRRLLGGDQAPGRQGDLQAQRRLLQPGEDRPSPVSGGLHRRADRDRQVRPAEHGRTAPHAPAQDHLPRLHPARGGTPARRPQRAGAEHRQEPPPPKAQAISSNRCRANCRCRPSPG